MTTYSQIANIDTRIADGTNANNNYGTGVQISIGHVAGNQVWRALLKWDLSSIPSNANITDATISLWKSGDNGNNGRTARLYRLKRAWTEAGATWNKYDGTNSWTTPGAGDTTNDRDSAELGTFTYNDTDAIGTRYDITLNNSLVTEWINGTTANNGLIIQADTENDDQNDYDSSESATSGERPLLVINYTTPSFVPKIIIF